jgi:hypothetical protein
VTSGTSLAALVLSVTRLFGAEAAEPHPRTQ